MIENPFSNQPVVQAGNNPNKHSHKLFLITITLGVLLVLISVFAYWSFANYLSQKSNVDGKIAVAASDAKKEQADVDEKLIQKAEKEPNREFSGPEDYGSVSFNYPKTWSIYVAKDASNGGNYEAYFNPIVVPTVSATQQYALRVVIQESDYDKVISGFSSLVSKGSLKSSSITLDNGNKGTRLDGNFSKDIRGSEVIFKIRDKTLTIRTDAVTFQTDFDALVQSIKFNL